MKNSIMHIKKTRHLYIVVVFLLLQCLLLTQFDFALAIDLKKDDMQLSNVLGSGWLLRNKPLLRNIDFVNRYLLQSEHNAGMPTVIGNLVNKDIYKDISELKPIENFYCVLNIIISEVLENKKQIIFCAKWAIAPPYSQKSIVNVINRNV